MKRSLICLAIAWAAAAAQADLVMQQQIVTPNYTGVATMKVKSTKVRLDLYAGQPQAFSTITDLNTGETITLMHSQKLFVRTAGVPMNQPASAGHGAASKAPVPHATGQTQKVGDYDTELYTWSNDRGIIGTAWVARNFPDYARVRADLDVLDKTAGADNDASPALGMLPGMVVRSQVAGGGQTITMALISAKEGPLDSSVFGLPRGYKELPRIQPVKTVVTQPAAQNSPGHPTPSTPASSPKTSTATPAAQKAPAW
ncbi:MAG: DUF4412 domain-containing protein [Verrucomicrobiia bacterium]